MKILSGLKQEPGKLIPSYKTINIRPKDILKTEDIGEVNVGTEVDLSATLLGNTKYTLEDIKFSNYYNYSYEQCVRISNCKNMSGTLTPSPGNTLVVIKDDITWDEDSSYYKNSHNKDIYYDLGSLSYTYEIPDTDEEKIYTSKLKNVTPSGLKNVKIYEVSNIVNRSKDVKLNIKIRNQSLVINLK